MSDLADLVEKVKSELDILNNKGIAALPAFFEERGIKAEPGNATYCVIAVYLMELFPGRSFAVNPRLGHKGNFVNSGSTDGFIEVWLDGGDISRFAINFDNGEYEQLTIEGEIL